MQWTKGPIQGVEQRPVKIHQDHRGWLAEMFRHDEIPEDQQPAMSYVSVTRPGVTRGPHEHRDQTDMFGFAGPGNFRVKLWDNRKDSPTYGKTLTLTAGVDQPMVVIVPPGVVHGYTNISEADAWVLNFPNRLFAGKKRKEPVDEIRHEDTVPAEFRMNED